MAEPILLYGVGATKAGTSWLYSALRAHPECRLRAVKETHFWDTRADATAQLAAYERRRAHFADVMQAAIAAGQGKKAANAGRHIAALEQLMTAVGTSGAQGEAAYWRWLTDGAGDARLVADITPSYALLDEATLARMCAFRPVTKVIYLVRDPLARLWSHVRMIVSRMGGAANPNDFARLANALLQRIIAKGARPEIVARGDYRGAVGKLQRVVPEGDLLVEFAEKLTTPLGWHRVCRFLGLHATTPHGDRKVHAGQKAEIDAGLRPQALVFLKDQYEWAARNLGPLPQAWQDNLARAGA